MKEARPFLMPKLGLTMTEGLVSRWCVAEGARFSANDILVIIETDKVAHEIEAPADGQLRRILVPEGETVPVSTVLGDWSLDGYADAPAVPGLPLSAPIATGLSMDTAMAAAPRPTEGGFIRATPLARRLARDSGLPLSHITGSGPNGRTLADDVRLAATAAVPVVATDPAACAAMVSRSAPSANERAMAARLVAAKRDIPHFYLHIDVEVSALLAFRRELNELAGRPRVSLTHLLVAAVARALQAAPHMNRVWIDDEIVSYGSIDIGLAVDTDRGLTNPIVRDLGHGSFYDLVAKIDDVIGRAREGRLKLPDMQGGAITISNAGRHDVRTMTSIIPPGQGAIIGVGSIQQCFRPDATGAPEFRQELGLVLSADHRLHTGMSALGFLEELRRVIAAPLSLVTGF